MKCSKCEMDRLPVLVIAESETLEKIYICPGCYSNHDSDPAEQTSANNLVVSISPKSTEIFGSFDDFNVPNEKRHNLYNYLLHLGESRRRKVYLTE